MNLINFFFNHPVPDLFKKSVAEKIITNIFDDEKINPSELSVIFVDDNYLTRLHDEYLNDTSKTDVITFDLSDKQKDLKGEIYISVDRAEVQSREYGTDFTEELYRYVIHGVLHLCGFEDIKNEARVIMKEKEEYYLQFISHQKTMEN